MEWSDTRAVLREVQSLFLRDDDLRAVEELGRWSAEIEQYHNNSRQGAKDLIKGKRNRDRDTDRDREGNGFDCSYFCPF